MKGRFDEAGNLWIGVEIDTVPQGFPKALQGLLVVSERAREINLTAYIRHIMLPSWVTGKLTLQQHKDWLKTIPEPIEPG